MSNFWNNISRYPRFLISSLAGLLFVIVTPLRNLFKIRKFRIILPVLLILFVILLYFILIQMMGF